MSFVSMAVRPNTLLGQSIIGIMKIWMPFELNVTGLTQPLLLGVLVGPGQKLSS
jgi:hypothetical protein